MLPAGCARAPSFGGTTAPGGPMRSVGGKAKGGGMVSWLGPWSGVELGFGLAFGFGIGFWVRGSPWS